MSFLLTNLETNRLKFRLINESDFDTWLPFFDNVEIHPFLFLDSSKKIDDLCRFWMDKCLDRYKDGRGGLMVIEDKHSKEFIGKCGLLVQDMDGDKRLEVGYSLLPQHQGKGYAIEAARFAREYAFKQEYDKDYDNLIVSMIHVDNKPSIKVALKNEMKLLKTFKATNNEDFHVYGQTREEWVAASK